MLDYATIMRRKRQTFAMQQAGRQAVTGPIGSAQHKGKAYSTARRSGAHAVDTFDKAREYYKEGQRALDKALKFYVLDGCGCVRYTLHAACCGCMLHVACCAL